MYLFKDHRLSMQDIERLFVLIKNSRLFFSQRAATRSVSMRLMYDNERDSEPIRLNTADSSTTRIRGP